MNGCIVAWWEGRAAGLQMECGAFSPCNDVTIHPFNFSLPIRIHSWLRIAS